MSQFTKPLIVQFVDNNLFCLTESFEYHVGSYPSSEIIVVPKGFITDFASVPRVFWSLIGPIDSHGKAAVIHDYLYEIKYKNDREAADKIFREALIVLGTPMWKVNVMYASVRMFGQTRWEGK